jgi:hypothetical protein
MKGTIHPSAEVIPAGRIILFAQGMFYLDLMISQVGTSGFQSGIAGRGPKASGRTYPLAHFSSQMANAGNYLGMLR